jgi:hypothetical protein
MGIAFLFYMPWLWVVIATAMHKAGFYKPIGLFSLPYTLYAFSVGYSLGPSVAELHTLWRGLAILRHLGPGVILTAILFGAAFVMGVLKMRFRFGKYALLVISLLIFPILLPMAVTLVSAIDFNARYAILAFPAYLLLVAAGLWSLRYPVERVMVGGGILLLMATSLWNLYTNVAYAKEDTRSAYKLVEAGWSPRDCVFVIGVGSAFRYYANASPIHDIWIDFRSGDGLADAERTLDRSSRDCGKAWLVSGREWEEDPLGLAVPTLGKYFDTTSERMVHGVRVLEMRPRERSASVGPAGSVDVSKLYQEFRN